MASSCILYFSYQDDARSNTHQIQTAVVTQRNCPRSPYPYKLLHKSVQYNRNTTNPHDKIKDWCQVVPTPNRLRVKPEIQLDISGRAILMSNSLAFFFFICKLLNAETCKHIKYSLRLISQDVMDISGNKNDSKILYQKVDNIIKL